MENKAKRRFVGLTVGEVSLVDSPANEEEFVVIKCLNAQEGATMPDDKNKTEGSAAPEQEEAVEKVAVQVEKPEDDAVQKALDKVVSAVESITKNAGGEPEAEAQTEKAAEGDGDNEAETEKAKKSPFQGSGIRELFIKKLKKAGLKGDDLKKAIADFDKEAKVSKSDDGEEVEKSSKETPAAEDAPASEDTLLEQLSVAIEKAKRFTPKRAGELQKAIDTLSSLATELQGTEKKQLPGATQYGGSAIKDITKSIGDLAKTLQESMTQVVETQKELGTRVESIEKERQPSQSVDEEGGTDKETETTKSLWSGVL